MLPPPASFLTAADYFGVWERALQMGALPEHRDGAWNEIGGRRALPGWTNHLGYTSRRAGNKAEASHLGEGGEL